MESILGNAQKPKELEGTFILTYEGPATELRSIDAGSYAKSLWGFTNAIKRISTKVLSTDISITLKDEKANCWKSVSDFVLSSDVQTVKNLAEWMIILAIPMRHFNKVPMAILDKLIDIIKKAKGKKAQIKDEIQALDIPIALKDELYKLAKDAEIREALDDMTEVLELDGIDSVEIQQKKYIVSKISKQERPSFIAQPEDETEEEYSERIVSIVYLSPDRSDWKFKDNKTEYWAYVTDNNFMEKMKDKRLEEISGDQYTATLHVVCTKEAGAKRTKIERTIYGFKEPPSQSWLPMS